MLYDGTRNRSNAIYVFFFLPSYRLFNAKKAPLFCWSMFPTFFSGLWNGNPVFRRRRTIDILRNENTRSLTRQREGISSSPSMTPREAQNRRKSPRKRSHASWNCKASGFMLRTNTTTDWSSTTVKYITKAQRMVDFPLCTAPFTRSRIRSGLKARFIRSGITSKRRVESFKNSMAENVGGMVVVWNVYKGK